MGHGESSAHAAQLLGDGGNELVRVAAGSHYPEQWLDIGIGCVVVIRHLGNGKDHHGSGRSGQAALVEVGDNADDRFYASLSSSRPVVDVLSWGLFAGQLSPGSAH